MRKFLQKPFAKNVKVLFSCLLAFMLITVNLQAQKAIRYSLAVTSGTYSSISGTGTSVAIAGDDAAENITGLTAFTVDGINYTNARMCSNGWLILYDATAPTATTNYSPLSTASGGGTNTVVITPFGRDLNRNNFSGTAWRQEIGNELIFEWKDYNRYSTASERLNFQVRLNTATGEITFVYGTMIAGSNATYPQVGWKTTGTTASNWSTDINNLTLNITGSPTSCNWSNAVTGNTNASTMYINSANAGITPSSGLTFTWTPQNTVDPVRTFSAVSGITATDATLTWTAPTGATQYNVRYRVAGTSCTWTNWSGNPAMSATATLTGLSAGTKYQYQILASDGTDNAIWSHIPNEAGTGDGYTATGSFQTLITCQTPTSLVGTPTTPTTADVSWTAPLTPPSNGYQYAVTTSATPPVSGTPEVGTSASVSGLTANTTYYLHVRSDCSGDYSTWVTSSAFTTPCNPATIPFTEGFESGQTDQSTVAGCFSQSSEVGSSSWKANSTQTTYNRAVRTGSFNAYLQYGNTDWLFYPLTLISGTTYEFKVYARQDDVDAADAYITLAYGTANNPAAMTNVVVNEQGIINGSYQEVKGNFTPTTSGTYYIGIKGYISGNPWYLSLDDISVDVAPNCLEPTALVGTPTTATTADVSWIAPLTPPSNGYQYAVTTSATPPVSGTLESGTTASVSGLTANTTYYLHVRSICGVGDTSIWATSSAFTTPCNPATIPFTEGFESGYTDQATVAGCFAQSSEAGAETWIANSTQTTYNRGARTGSFNATLIYDNTDWLFYPLTLNSGTTYEFKVYARQDDVNAADAYITLAYGTANNPVAMTNVVVNEQGIINGSYQEVKGNFTPTTSGTYYIGIKGYISGNPWYLSLDDISVDVAPNCVPPTALAGTPTSETTANVSWTAPLTPPSLGYEYAVTTSATPPVSGTLESGTTASVSGLTANTTYYLHVRSVCSIGDTSSWATSGSFTTPVVTTVPWTEGFATVTLPTGWALSAYSGPSTVTALNSGASTNYLYKNLWSSAPTGSFTTISVGALTGVEFLAFKYRTADYNSPYNPPAVGSGYFLVDISTDYGTTYTRLDSVGNNGAAGWQNYSFDLTSYTGQYVKIRITGGWISGDYYLGFDDFMIAAECTAPTAQGTTLNLTPATTTVDGSFTASVPASDGYLVVRTPNLDVPSNPVNGTSYTAGQSALGGTIVYSGSSTSFSDAGLTPGSQYSYHIFTFNNTGCAGIAYNTTGPLNGNATTLVLYTSVQSGAWNDAATWDLNAVPTFANDVVIANGHTVTVNAATANGAVTTINSGGTLVVSGSTLNIASLNNSGTVTASGGTLYVSGAATSGITNNSGATFTVSGSTIYLGPAGGSNRTFTNNGTLAVSSGTLTINGNYKQITSTGTLTQSGGDIVIDGNAAGVLVNSVGTGTYLFQAGTSGASVTSSTFNLSGGTITIVDPHASTTSTYALYVYTSTNFSATGTHTFKFGDGVSTDAGGSTNGLYIYLYPGSYYALNNVVVDLSTGTNRLLSGYLYALRIGGNITITSGEFLNNNGLYVNGNIINYGTLTSSNTLYFANYTNGSNLASTNAQTLTGSGTYRNSQSSPTANFAGFSVNNTHVDGVSFDVGITNPTFSGGLTVTNGKITANTIIFSGTTSVTLSAATSIINANYVSHHTAGNVSLSGTGWLNVYKSFSFGNVDNRTFNANGRMVLKSTATNTTYIADITNGGVNSGNAIGGNIVQERFIPAKASRKWIFLSSPLSQTIAASWQQQIHVTGAGTGGTNCPTLTPHSNGFDASLSNTPSMYSYNAANLAGTRWTAVANTNATNVGMGVGYRVNVRGDRSLGCSLLDGTPAGLIPGEVTLRSTGSLSAANKNVGSFSITYPNAGINNYVFMGNPYPSAISFSALQGANNLSINTNYAIYIAANAPGTYSYWSDDDGEFTGGVGYDNATGNILANGQAFFVQSSVAGDVTLNFSEAQKTTETNTGYFRTARVFNEKLKVNYLKDNQKVDEVVIRYANDATVSNTAIGKMDIPSMNSGTYITSLKDNKGMVVQTRELQSLTTDEVWLNIGATESGNYQLNFSNYENFAGASIILKDHYTQTEQDVKQNATYSFSIDKDNAATKGNARFSIVFNRTIEPVYVTNMIKMYPNPANKQVTLQLPQSADNSIVYQIKVTDLVGKVIMQEKANGGTTLFNIDRLTTGTYLVEIIDSKGNRTTEKLVKQ
jgi:hypothetical protein